MDDIVERALSRTGPCARGQCRNFQAQLGAEIERLRTALEQISKSSNVGYVLRGGEDFDTLAGLIAEFYREFKDRVELARAALSPGRDDG